MASATDLTDAVMKLPLRQKTKLLKMLSRDIIGRHKSGLVELKYPRKSSIALSFVPKVRALTEVEARKLIPDYDLRKKRIEDESNLTTVFEMEIPDEEIDSV